MALFALVKNNTVQNIIVADQDFIKNFMQSQYDYCVEYQQTDVVEIGFTYDPNSKIFTGPLQPSQ